FGLLPDHLGAAEARRSVGRRRNALRTSFLKTPISTNSSRRRLSILTLFLKRNLVLPSFLVECLVYRVEDDYFLVDADDRYDRLLRLVRRMHGQLNDPVWAATANEINEIKLLFGPHQPWTIEVAKRFSAAAWNRLMA